MPQGYSQHPDLQQVMIDSTIDRAYACPTGAAGSNVEAEVLGGSKGGFTTKIHAITDALLPPTPAGAGVLLGGKGYDSDAFVQGIQKEKHASSHSASQQPDCAA
jgi:hypothetical protein